jgi:hypothetical protein
MGVIGSLLLAPLAPVRLALWVSEKVADEAERQQYSQGAVLARLREVERAVERGEISDREARQREAQIIASQMPAGGSQGAGVALRGHQEDVDG